MEKRGQTTLFIILGIVLVLIIIIAVLLMTSDQTEVSQQVVLPEEVDNLRAQIESCSEDLSEGSLVYAGLHGGYSYIDDIETYKFDTGEELGTLDIPYLYYEGEDNSLFLLEIIDHMRLSIKEEMDDCIGFDNFQFTDFEKEDLEITIAYTEDKIEFDIYYPVSLTFEDSQYSIDDTYTYKADIRLDHINDAASEIVSSNLEDSGYIPTSYILSSDLNIDYWIADDVTGVYMIQDDNSLINKESFLYLFAVKYEETIE